VAIHVHNLQQLLLCLVCQLITKILQMHKQNTICVKMHLVGIKNESRTAVCEINAVNTKQHTKSMNG